MLAQRSRGISTCCTGHPIITLQSNFNDSQSFNNNGYTVGDRTKSERAFSS